MFSRRSILFAPAALAAVRAAPALAQGPAPTVRPGVHGHMAALFNSGTRPLIMLRSQGGPPAPMVFDTGTSGNALDTPYAELIGAKRTGDAEVIDGATGRAVDGAFDTVLPDVSLGGVAVGDQEMSVYPRQAFNEAGIVGPNAFGGRLVTMDLARSRIYVRPRTRDSLPRGQAHPYIEREGGVFMPGLPIRFPGFTAMGMTDSGNDGELGLPLEMADRLPLEAPPVEAGRAVSVSGSQPIYEARIAGDIAIGPITLSRPRVHFKGRVPNIGASLLRRMLIVYDPEGRQTWLLEPGPARSALDDYVGRYGDSDIRQDGDHLVYQRDGRAPRALHHYGDDLFELRDPDAQLQFVRVGGRIVGFDLLGRGLMQVPRVDPDA